MFRTKLLAITVVCLMVASVYAGGGLGLGGGAPKKDPVDIQTVLQRKVTFQFKDTALANMIGFMKDITRVAIELGDDVDCDQCITLKCTAVTLEVALNMICQQINAKIVIRGQKIILTAGGGGDEKPDPIEEKPRVEKPAVEEKPDVGLECAICLSNTNSPTVFTKVIVRSDGMIWVRQVEVDNPDGARRPWSEKRYKFKLPDRFLRKLDSLLAKKKVFDLTFKKRADKIDDAPGPVKITVSFTSGDENEIVWTPAEQIANKKFEYLRQWFVKAVEKAESEGPFYSKRFFREFDKEAFADWMPDDF